MSFPCWDEPIYKATFDVTLEVDKNFTALSNMVQLHFFIILYILLRMSNPLQKTIKRKSSPSILLLLCLHTLLLSLLENWNILRYQSFAD